MPRRGRPVNPVNAQPRPSTSTGGNTPNVGCSCGEPSGPPAPWALDVSSVWASGSVTSRRALSATLMGDGGVSILPMREGVYPGPVNSGWNVPGGTLGCPVSMGRCVASAISIISGSTFIASVAFKISVD